MRLLLPESDISADYKSDGKPNNRHQFELTNLSNCTFSSILIGRKKTKMNKIVFLAFCAVAASVLVVFAEPVEYRANQRVRALEKQQQKPDPDSENIEATTENKNSPKQPSGELNGKQQAEEVEVPKTETDATTEADEKTTEQPQLPQLFVPTGWKAAGNLLVLPPGLVWVAPRTTTPAAKTTTEEGAEGTTAEAETSTATEEAETESATTESATTEAVDTTEDNRLARTKVETTSEPDAESVDAEATSDSSDGETPEVAKQPEEPQVHQQPPAVNAVNTFFIQLPDGSLQRVVFLNNGAGANYATSPFTAPLQLQPFVQPQPFGIGSAYAPNAAPRFVSYTAQYQVHGK